MPPLLIYKLAFKLYLTFSKVCDMIKVSVNKKQKHKTKYE